MKSRTQGAGTNWTPDGDILTVFIPMMWKRRGGQKVIIAPDGGDAWAPAKARPDETLIRALARAHRWNRMLEVGNSRSIAEIAAAEKINRAYVSRLLDLTLLAPDIQEAILEGRQAKGVQLEQLTKAMPGVWEEQRRSSVVERCPADAPKRTYRLGIALSGAVFDRGGSCLCAGDVEPAARSPYPGAR